MPDLTIPRHDGAALHAYLAQPPVGTGPWPGVVVVHDIFGLSDIAREHADRLAAAGYLALVPDLFTRGGMLRCVRATFARMMRGSGTALQQRGIAHDVKEYPDAGHGFMDRFNAGPFTPVLRVAGLGYHHASAEDAWRRILRFFAEYL